MQKYLICAILLFFGVSCSNSSQPRLNLNDSILEQTFSPQELAGVDQIIMFMDSTAFAGCNCQNLENAYTNLKYTPEIFNQAKFDKVITDMKADGLYRSFWNIRLQSDSINATYLDFNMNGKLFKLVERLSEVDEVAREYYGYLMRDRDISPALEAMFPANFPKVDVSRPAVRLLIATHLMFLKESEKYSKKRMAPLRIEDMDSD